jgi:hypothetical protein
MLKFLIILGIIAYILYKIGSFFFRAGVASQQLRQQEMRHKQRKEAAKSGGKIKDGEYVDYEDVR